MYKRQVWGCGVECHRPVVTESRWWPETTQGGVGSKIIAVTVAVEVRGRVSSSGRDRRDDALEGRNVVGGNRINTPVFPCAVISTRHGRNRCEREDS